MATVKSRQALRALTPAVPRIARHNNVPVDPPIFPAIARLALSRFSSEGMTDLVKSRQHAVDQADFAISHELDVYAAFQFGCVLAALEGDESPNRAQMMVAAKQCVDNEPFDPSRPTVKIWPNLVDAAKTHLETRRAQNTVAGLPMLETPTGSLPEAARQFRVKAVPMQETVLKQFLQDFTRERTFDNLSAALGEDKAKGVVTSIGQAA
ncbi:MAG: hypothetical protein K2Y27_30140 [Xanthobacteraceae bacterium]|nr:hypothetical protein [Xanthobacteraceae bacterium]